MDELFDPGFWLSLITTLEKKEDEFSQMYTCFESEVQQKVDCILSELHKHCRN